MPYSVFKNPFFEYTVLMKPFSARVLLAAVFIARGTSFLFSKQLLTNLSPMSILAVRFLLAFLVLALIFNKKIRQLDHKSLKGGMHDI